MSQIIRYRNRDKGVSIKLREPVTEGHGLDGVKQLHSTLLMSTSRVIVDLHEATGAPQK
jgi:hypothetical protein